MHKLKILTACLVTLFMIFLASPTRAEEVPASDAVDAKLEGTPLNDQVGDDSAEDEKPTTPCQGACLEHAKMCNDSCKSLADDDAEQNDCNKACIAVFTNNKGFCFSHCNASEKFLTPCKAETEDAPARTGDECLDGCENHYGTCVMSCRDNIKDNAPKLKGCYDNCTQIFAEETGFCKSQCDVDAGFMEICE